MSWLFCILSNNLEYIDINLLSKVDARNLIIEREQHFLDQIFSADESNTFNILTVAGSRLGSKHTPESLAKFSGANNPRGMLGKCHSAEAIDKIRASQGTAIFVYDSQGSLVNTFSSAREAGKEFDAHHQTIMKYVRNGNIFQEKWYLSNSKDFIVSSNNGSSDSEK